MLVFYYISIPVTEYEIPLWANDLNFLCQNMEYSLLIACYFSIGAPNVCRSW